jgi:hypothetical protein
MGASSALEELGRDDGVDDVGDAAHDPVQDFVWAGPLDPLTEGHILGAELSRLR